jgi:hypothetical protein
LKPARAVLQISSRARITVRSFTNHYEWGISKAIRAVAAIPPEERTELLLRVIQDDGHVAAELKRRILQKCTTPCPTLRTVGELRRRAREVREAYERSETECKEAERRRQAGEAEKARRARLGALRQRGETVWREIEDEIGRRNASGYDPAANLVSDLQAIAAEGGQPR